MANSEKRKEMAVLRKCRQQIQRKKWKCMVEGCEEDAINSHILQRHGILDNITEDNHFYELRPKNIFTWTQDSFPAEFRRVGINEAISQPLFCSHHDTDLFIDIEKTEPNLYDYRSQLLFTYRSVCSEIHKKQFEIAFNKRQISCNDVLGLDVSLLNQVVDAYQRGVNDLVFYKILIEQELKASTDSIVFKVFEYPKIPIYASSPFSFETNPDKLNSATSTWDGAFFHIIPLPTNLYILIGYHKDYISQPLQDFISLWDNNSKEELGLNLTDMFSQRIESFGMSPSLYHSLTEENKEKFFNFMAGAYKKYDMNRRPDFNLFEGEMWNCIEF